jgi:hypothetical protein
VKTIRLCPAEPGDDGTESWHLALVKFLKNGDIGPISGTPQLPLRLGTLDVSPYGV